MITLKGYAAVGVDGTFYSISVRNTHTGTHAEWFPCKSIDQAQVFYAPHWRFRGHGEPDKMPEGGIKFVPVTQRIEVVLEGFGHTP